MILRKVTLLVSLLIAATLSLRSQQPSPTSGDVTVRLSEPIDFATARPLQAVRSVVVSSSNPAIPAGSLAVLQLQNRDGSYTLKLMRIAAGGPPLKTMSEPGVLINGSPASGPHASLANGAMLRFTLTQQDGSPGAPVQQAALAASQPAQVLGGTSTASLGGGTTKDRANFEIEGVKLGMSLPELRAVAKAYPPKVSAQGGETAVTFKTTDLEFSCVFSKGGVLRLMEVYSLRKTVGANALSSLQSAAKNSKMYQKAVDVYGPPDDASASDAATWKGANGSTAAYSLDGDALEVSAKQ